MAMPGSFPDDALAQSEPYNEGAETFDEEVINDHYGHHNQYNQKGNDHPVHEYGHDGAQHHDHAQHKVGSRIHPNPSHHDTPNRNPSGETQIRNDQHGRVDLAHIGEENHVSWDDQNAGWNDNPPMGYRTQAEHMGLESVEGGAYPMDHAVSDGHGKTHQQGALHPNSYGHEPRHHYGGRTSEQNYNAGARTEHDHYQQDAYLPDRGHHMRPQGYQYPDDPIVHHLDRPHHLDARRRIRRRGHRNPFDQQQVQIVMSEDKERYASSKGLSETMQMMMMYQMMNQQMANQQMQMVQMNQMMERTSSVTGQQKAKGRKRPVIDIKTKQRARKAIKPVPVVLPQAPPPVNDTIESAAMENWQEATIILCIAIVGVIYLIVSRSSKEEGKDPNAVAKHLVPK